MRWEPEANPWRNRFALFPICLPNGPTKKCIWLEWYWARHGGDCTEVSFTDPAISASRGEGEK